MIQSIIQFSVHNKLLVGILIAIWLVTGLIALQQLPLDAVPDITNNQVQVVTVSPSLAAQEVEQFITYPVEVAMANIPNLEEIRSISRFGLSVVTIVFKDHVPILEARQLVKEQVGLAEAEIPAGMGQPELMPITTGLGEIYQYVLKVKPGFEAEFDAMRLRTIQDWIVKRQLAGTPGIVEVSSFGGYLKQYEVAVDPLQLKALGISVRQVFEALEQNNENSGSAYIEKNTNAYYIRTEGLIRHLSDIEKIVIAQINNSPVLVKDVAQVQWGSPKRFGAMTMDGQGEAVGGITLMLKGGNSSEAIANVHERIESIQKSLPEGLEIYPYLDRSKLIGKTTHTVEKNLLEGGIIVVVVLMLLLGDIRAGLIVASVIPLAMLFAIILMNYFGISANLMSLGAIDFGIVVDGAVIVVEGVLHALFTYHVGKQLTHSEMDEIVIDASTRLFRSTVFGVFIILLVFIPIMTLTGVEGKMFRPMAMTFSFAVLGALILSLTYIPAVTAWVMPKKIKDHDTFADRIVRFLRRLYRPTLELALRLPLLTISSSVLVLVGSFFIFQSLGAVFIPTLEEGDLAMQMAIKPGSSLSESVRTSTKAEKLLLDNFPEIEHIVSKIGTAEVPTDPMAIEDADIMIVLKEKSEWVSARNREELVEKMKEKLSLIVGASFEFTQPIQLRFNELMTGAKTDVAVKIFGENTETLKMLGDKAAAIIEKIPGAADVKVERTEGLPQLKIQYDRQQLARYGWNIADLNSLVRMAYAGETAGVVFENEQKFDLVLRFDTPYREALNLEQLFIPLANGATIPFSEVASLTYAEGPMQISRENTRRFIGIGINVRNRDVASLVADIEAALESQLVLPPGYTIAYGGEFENLVKAKNRLMLAVPAALFLIFVLLYFTFARLKYALIIFTAVPLSAIGGIIALWIRDMPFSISAGVGFIALFGVAVLNGIVLISYFNYLRYEKGMTDLKEIIIEGACVRLRPVLMTATVAALGFLPMAISTSNGAEVQKPLATVVIGGLITATLLTMIVLPVLYMLVNKKLNKPSLPKEVLAFVLLAFTLASARAQTDSLNQEQVLEYAYQHHPLLQNAALNLQKAQLGINQANELPATDFNLGLGQINSNLIDYNFSVEQTFLAPGLKREKIALAQAKMEHSQEKMALTRHQLEIAIRQAWNDWNYEAEQLRLLGTKQAYLQEVHEKMKARYEAGELGKLEITLSENQLLQTQRATESGLLRERKAYYQLCQAAYLPDSTAFKPSASYLQELSLPDSQIVTLFWLAPAEQAVEVAQREVAVQQQSLLPSYKLGYFNQSIRPDYSFQGVSAGISIPIWQKHLKARIATSQVDGLVAINELEWQKTELTRLQKQAWEQVTRLQQQLQTYARSLQTQQSSLLELSLQQWQNGEIDYFTYLQSLTLALQNDLAYLDLIYQYHQAVLEWEKWRH
ncbi:MAG TPA: CusA/CzcA family heavy metal efflux RND transporter [Saprospiraceae bacterium]|mgnify:CR=1 FL=1|nr:CusA/CzcA family heavy metal efflux RND transporter [Saprospiraceae bacterium]HMQ84738.1 CusA/CzcA family heavy metal efflux RND transporter [Saprospiraceae bacterium]